MNVAANTAKVSADGSIATHSDVVVTTIADNEVLAWNSGTSKWINQTATEAGLASASHTHPTSDITSGTMADARIAKSNVTQHEGAIVHQNLSGAGTNTHAQIDTHLASTSNPHSVTKSQVGLSNVQNTKVKLDATTAPTINNDTSEGYTVGSRWIDVTGDKAYVCLDNTDGAAVWTETTQSGGSGDVTAASNLLTNFITVGDDGVKGIRTRGWTINSDNVLDSNFSHAGYILDVHNTLSTGGGNGFRIMAGETLGDIAFHVADQDDTFQIMELEADQGYLTLGKTYAQTLIDNGIVYGIDIQHAGQAVDFNTQNGVYRIAGDPVMPNTHYQYAESEGESTTTALTYQTKITFTTGTLPSGTYRIDYSSECSSTGASLVDVQVDVSGTVIANYTLENDNDWPSLSGFKDMSLAGAKTVTMKYMVDTSGQTAKIRRARMSIHRVA